MTAELRRHGWQVNRKRVSRLMRKMGIEAIYPKPRTSIPAKGHRIFPYLLKGREIRGPDEVWCADITYVPMASGFMYLMAVMDWFSRYMLAWRLSNTLDTSFCLDALEAALGTVRKPRAIFNTDQAKTSHIITNAHAVNEGRVPEIPAKPPPEDDFFFIERDEPEAINATIVKLVRDRLPERFGFDPNHDIQVLAPMNRGSLAPARSTTCFRKRSIRPARSNSKSSASGPITARATG